jgi:bacillolysin
MKTRIQKKIIFVLFIYAWSSGLFAQNPAPLNYCASRGMNTLHGCINKVSMESINNTSGNNNGCGDFVKVSTKLQKDSDYTVELTPGFVNSVGGGIYFEYWSVYIDFNQDGAFESSELVAHGNAAIRINKSFRIPSTALSGPTRMRIQMQPGAEQTNPCGVYAYGEVEDYTVDLVDNITETANAKGENDQAEMENNSNKVELFPNPARDMVSIRVNFSDANATLNINVYNQLGQKTAVSVNISTSGTNIFTFNTSKMTPGLYIIEVECGHIIQRQKLIVVSK